MIRRGRVFKLDSLSGKDRKNAHRSFRQVDRKSCPADAMMTSTQKHVMMSQSSPDLHQRYPSISLFNAKPSPWREHRFSHFVSRCVGPCLLGPLHRESRPCNLLRTLITQAALIEDSVAASRSSRHQSSRQSAEQMGPLYASTGMRMPLR